MDGHTNGTCWQHAMQDLCQASSDPCGHSQLQLLLHNVCKVAQHALPANHVYVAGMQQLDRGL